MTLYCPVREWARTRPGSLALIAGERRWTYAQLDEEVQLWVDELLRLGVQKGDRVALQWGNEPEFVFAIHAATRLGATSVPLNSRLKDVEVASLLDDVRPRCVLSARTEPARAWRKQGLAPIPLAAELVQAILFTSGTTGRSKGAELTVGNFLASARASAENLGGGSDQRWLACLPLFHVGGMAMLTRCAWYGAGLVLHPKFDPGAVLDSLERDGVSHVSLVGAALARLLDVNPSGPPAPSLKTTLIGGGPVSPDLMKRARSVSLPALLTYGLTEATSQVTTEPLASPDGRTAGPPLVGINVRVVDESGAPLPMGGEGEIEVRGPTVMRGYFSDETATRASLRGGWLRTFDIGSLDERGRLIVLARRTDLILSGGENVYPAEVERVLASHPGIGAVAVIAEPDSTWGQVPIAGFVPRGNAPSAEELDRFCRSRLAGFKVPKRFVKLDALPQNATGKLDRVAVANRIREARRARGIQDS